MAALHRESVITFVSPTFIHLSYQRCLFIVALRRESFVPPRQKIFTNICLLFLLQTFAGQDEFMEELLGDEYYVDLFAQIADSEPITEAIDEVTLSSSSCAFPPTPPALPSRPCFLVDRSLFVSLARRVCSRLQKHEKYIVGHMWAAVDVATDSRSVMQSVRLK